MREGDYRLIRAHDGLASYVILNVVDGAHLPLNESSVHQSYRKVQTILSFAQERCGNYLFLEGRRCFIVIQMLWSKEEISKIISLPLQIE